MMIEKNPRPSGHFYLSYPCSSACIRGLPFRICVYLWTAPHLRFGCLLTGAARSVARGIMARMRMVSVGRGHLAMEVAQFDGACQRYRQIFRSFWKFKACGLPMFRADSFTAKLMSGLSGNCN